MKTFEQRPPALKRQRGIVLLVTLLALVAMTLASVGMMRSVDTSVMAVGNIAFKQSADAAVNFATERAMLQALVLSATADDAMFTDGDDCYYASIQPNQDSRGVPRFLHALGTGTVCRNGPDAAGNTTRHMVERMCRNAGEVDPGSCTVLPIAGQGVLRDAPTLLGRGPRPELRRTGGASGGGAPLYRVSIRVDGPNNTVSFAQAIVSL